MASAGLTYLVWGNSYKDPELWVFQESWIIIWRLMLKQITYLTHVALSFLSDTEVTLLSHALPRTEYKQATWFVVLTFRKKSNYFSRTCITFVVENFNSRILNALGEAWKSFAR